MSYFPLRFLVFMICLCVFSLIRCLTFRLRFLVYVISLCVFLDKMSYFSSQISGVYDLSFCVIIDKMSFFSPQIPSFNSTCVRLYVGENCERVVGYRAVYRLSVGLVGFFAIMMVLTPCIPSSNHWRGSIQNG